jgi:hypothetical protein
MEKTLNSKLLDFQKRVGIVKKDSKNPHFKNTYASLTQILGEVKPLLTECGLVLVQPISLDGVGTTIIDCETGEKIETIISLPSNLNPQQLGSAITYFRRYTLASLLALEIDDDDAQSTVKPTATIKETKLPELTPDKFKAMIDAINDGKKLTVQTAMNNYTITDEQMKMLNIAIQNN